ncbi:50S ribosomal protein L18 [Persicobacter psychrovividus]|uniref:Large ribosomal subunit protein uL18 n=1 Tax=Persicobacter psychrovividus TaxID=387638 RepID=A0ABN6LA14_9BACT|nr:50S ribosomal protein L18 [Persicobacter psychrovividus]
MAIKNEKIARRLRIRRGIRRKISGTAQRPRLSVYKSNTAISAQLIDDINGVTLASATSVEFGARKNCNIEISEKVGAKLAEKAVANSITEVVFDRSGYQYHGKVKALAEGARNGGLKF